MVTFSGGDVAKDVASGLKLRHEPAAARWGPRSPTAGSQFLADDDQRELTFLGIESSPAFVRKPEGNGCALRFIRVPTTRCLIIFS